MCGQGADGGSEAARAGEPAPEFARRADVYLESAGGARRGACMAGVVPRVEHHYCAGGAVHGNPVPAVGGAEALAASADRAGARVGRGRRVVGQRGGGGGRGGDDAVGCVEDADDAGEGETAHVHHAEEYIAGEWAEGVFRGDRAEDRVD